MSLRWRDVILRSPVLWTPIKATRRESPYSLLDCVSASRPERGTLDCTTYLCLKGSILTDFL